MQKLTIICSSDSCNFDVYCFQYALIINKLLLYIYAKLSSYLIAVQEREQL